MIEKKLKTTGGKLSIKIPGSINELTLGQLMQLQGHPGLNDLEAINILSGIPIDDLLSVTNIADFQLFSDVIIALSGQIKELYNSDAIPKYITFQIDGKIRKVNVISNLSVEPAGAYMAASEVIAEEINLHIEKYGLATWKENFNPSLNACCQILAHYFYCRATGQKYNEYKAEAFCDTIKQLGVTEALPVAKHFFTCYPNLLKPKTSFWQRCLQRLKKRPAFRHSASSNISIP